jgi:hypothetical protein
MDVIRNGGREQADAGICGTEAETEVGGGDLLVDGRQKMDASALDGSEGKRGELRFGEGKVRSADDDPLGEFEQAAGRTPTTEFEKAVRSGEDKERGRRRFELKSGKRVYGVVGGSVETWGIDAGDGEARGGILRTGSAGEANHGEAVGVAGDGGLGFEGLEADRSKENAVEGKGVCGSVGDGQMAAMDGVECAPEEGDA